MSDAHSTTTPARSKPVKPRPDFPLFPHLSGQWAKKIRGKMYYFGPWEDPEAALNKYLARKDDLHAGRKPRPDADAVTVKELCNAFLAAKQALVDAGELSPQMWADYKGATDLMVSRLGKTRRVDDLRADDFAPLRQYMASRWGPYRLAKVIQCIRSVLKYAYDAELVKVPVRCGPAFRGPSKKVVRMYKASCGPKLFTAPEIRSMLDAAGVQLRAMLLLGVNCGYGNADVGTLPLQAVDLQSGWIDYPRPKTGIGRRCRLWPETVAALREALANRPQPKTDEDAGLVFVTKYGGSWAKEVADSPITKETRKLLDRLGIDGRRNFYALRHTFRTVADAAKDQPAADHIMGHEVAHMSSVYREGIDDVRLQAVADHVHRWLFPAATPE